MMTMPDIDTGVQATGLVRVVALNVDANHDGTMNFTYNSPDFVSSSKPFRFWVDDSQDSGDYGGTGVPGQGTQGKRSQGFDVQDETGHMGWLRPSLRLTLESGRLDLNPGDTIVADDFIHGGGQWPLLVAGSIQKLGDSDKSVTVTTGTS